MDKSMSLKASHCYRPVTHINSTTSRDLSVVSAFGPEPSKTPFSQYDLGKQIHEPGLFS